MLDFLTFVCYFSISLLVCFTETVHYQLDDLFLIRGLLKVVVESAVQRVCPKRRELEG